MKKKKSGFMLVGFEIIFLVVVRILSCDFEFLICGRVGRGSRNSYSV